MQLIVVVHARGAAAHGYFESYADWSNITAASFLGQAGKQTPVFLRFSTVAGSRGSVDTARDVHGFALRFYTDAGNYGESWHTSIRNDDVIFYRYCRKQHSRLFHSGRNPISRLGTRFQTETGQ